MCAFTPILRSAAALTMLLLACTQASAGHLFVSPLGNDGGNGTAFAPFLTLQGAVAGAQSGDVIQLEMGGNYGGAVINDKTLTIISTQDGGVMEPGVAGIIFNGVGNNDVLTVQGLRIDQAGSANNGIIFNSGRKLNVIDTVIQNGSGGSSGIFFQPNDAFAEINILDSIIAEFGTTGSSAGIRISPRSGGDVDALLEDVTAINNRVGVSVTAGTNSVVDVFLDDVDLSGGGTGILSTGAGSTVRVANSVITNNTVLGLSHPGTAKLISVGGNVVRANTANGGFTATEAQQ